MRGVLGVDDGDVDLEIAAQPRKVRLYRLASWAADYIATEQDVHCHPLSFASAAKQSLSGLASRHEIASSPVGSSQ